MKTKNYIILLMAAVIFIIVYLAVSGYISAKEKAKLSAADKNAASTDTNSSSLSKKEQAIKDYGEAVELLGYNRIDEAVRLFEKIIRENPGTDIAADSRFELAGIYGYIKRDKARMLQEYETILQEYEGTPVEYEAKSDLISLFYENSKTPFSVYLEKKNELITSSGGISVYDILEAKDLYNEEWWDIIQNGSFKYGIKVLINEYFMLACSFSAPTEREDESPRVQDEIKMFKFIRAYFPKYVQSVNTINLLTDTVRSVKGIDNIPEGIPEDESPPVIRAIAPRAGLTIGDKRPKIEVELHDGDVFQGQIKTETLVFTLNGKDLTDEMRIRTSYNESCKQGVVFEKMRLIYKPKENLPPGQYTVYIKAEDIYKQSSEESWSFNIK